MSKATYYTVYDSPRFYVGIPEYLLFKLFSKVGEVFPKETGAFLVGYTFDSFDDARKRRHYFIREIAGFPDGDAKLSEDQFNFSPKTAAAVHQRSRELGMSVLGLVHSHAIVPPTPSGTDMETFNRDLTPDQLFLIVDANDCTVNFYTGGEGKGMVKIAGLSYSTLRKKAEEEKARVRQKEYQQKRLRLGIVVAVTLAAVFVGYAVYTGWRIPL